MPVTDLTNTTWVFNETLEFTEFGFASGANVSKTYSVNLQSNGSTFSRIMISHATNNNCTVYYGYTVVYQEYNNVKWKNAQQRLVTFTGGSKATDATLIAWVEANAQRFYTPYRVTENELTSVADAIRTKGGTSATLEWPQGYIDAINAL